MAKLSANGPHSFIKVGQVLLNWLLRERAYERIRRRAIFDLIHGFLMASSRVLQSPLPPSTGRAGQSAAGARRLSLYSLLP